MSIVFAIILFCDLFLGFRAMYIQDVRYRYDKTNPYRRMCKKCGAYQEQYTNAERTHSWWEEHREGNNPKCGCHRDSIINTY